MKNAILILLSLIVASCARFENSPFTDHIDASGSNANLGQQQRLLADPQAAVPTGTMGITIALMSDSHLNYNDVDTVADLINQRHDVNFAVHDGDMTDNAYNFQYDAFIAKFNKIQVPHFAVIGNHDSIGKGRKIYQNYFGAYNYSFVYQGYHFIFFNDNRLEFINDGWSLDWLETELAKNPTLPKVVFQHINYDNTDAFPEDMSAQMKSLYENNNVQWVINGHRHVFGFGIENGVHYLQIPRTEDASYIIFHLEQDGSYEFGTYKGASCENTYQGTASH